MGRYRRNETIPPRPPEPMPPMSEKTLDPTPTTDARPRLELRLGDPQTVVATPVGEEFLGHPKARLCGPAPPLLSPASWSTLRAILPQLAPGSEHPLRVNDADGRSRMVTLRVIDGRCVTLVAADSVGDAFPEEDLLDRALATAQDGWGDDQVQNLAQRGEDLQRILYHSPGILLVLVPTEPLRFAYVSENIDRLGHRADRIMAGEVGSRALFHPDDHDRFLTEIARHCDDTETSDFRVEFRWLTHDGSPRWMDVHLWVNRDETGDVRELQGLAWDITERKRAEEKHRVAVSTVELLNCSVDTLEVLQHILNMLCDHAGLDGAEITIRHADGSAERHAVGFEDLPPIATDSCQLCQTVMGGATCGLCQCPSALPDSDNEMVRSTPGGSRWTNSAAFVFYGCAHQGALPADADIRDGSLALVPLRASGRSLGMMQLRSPRSDAFDEVDIEFFESLGASIGIALDRERAVRRLRSSEERYRGLFDTSRDGIVIRTLDGRIEDANHAYLRMVGRSLSELQHESTWKYLRRPESVETGVCYPGQLLGEGCTQDQEFEVVRPDGSVILVMSRSWLMNDDTGSPFRELAIMRDITRARQEELEHRRLVAAVEQSDEIVMITDVDGRIQYVNPAFERTTGYPRAEALGRTPAILRSGQHSDEFYRDLWSTISNGETWEGRFINRRKDGSLYHEDATISCVRNDLGRITNFVAVKRDVTKLVQLETDLLQAQKLESIGRLAAGIAHEINTPSQYVGDNVRFLQESFEDLAGVLGAASAIVERSAAGEEVQDSVTSLAEEMEKADVDYLLEEIPAAISQSLEGLGRVSQIVGAMKTFSHPGADEMTPIDLNRAIESTTTVSRNEWKYVADLELELDPDLPPVPCLPNEFNQVVLNMVVNAAHAIEAKERAEGEKGRIIVRTAVDGDHAVVQIQDTGSGIPESVRDRIFDPFFTTKDVGKGTGQGLSIARDIIVEKHEGTISVETEVGVGTTFTIRLPLRHTPTIDDHSDGDANVPSPSVAVFSDDISDGDEEIIG